MKRHKIRIIFPYEISAKFSASRQVKWWLEYSTGDASDDSNGDDAGNDNHNDSI